MSSLETLLEAVDRFLSEAGKAEKQRAIEEAERKIFKLAQTFFTAQGKIFAREHAKYQGKYSETIGADELQKIMDALTSADDAFTEAYLPIALRTMDEAGVNLLSVPGFDVYGSISFSLENPEAVAFMTSHGAELVTGINAETMAQMQTLLAQATEEGWSYAQTAKEIKARFDGFAGKMPQAHIRSRAELVSVTESRFAYEQGNLQTGRWLAEQGLEMEKSWLESGDEAMCDDCEGNAADGWIGIEDSFSSGDDAPPAHPACRCTMEIQRKGAGEE